MNIIWFNELDSTNNAILNDKLSLKDRSVYATVHQTAGKGQRGNKWESAKGENLTFSILFKPERLKAEKQFEISEAVTLGIVDYLRSKGIEAKIKWPNDIYVGDKKICGILIENSVSEGLISHSVVGIGVNVNQTLFLSDAPNPVSMANITGERYNINKELVLLTEYIEAEYDAVNDDTEKRYLDSLYRINEWHEYIDRTSETRFKGKITGVDKTARLVLLTENGEKRAFAFKEVAYCI
ncbi:MAG: biotin--[Bacteroidales bacterium]|nr:biotin--[acetyl-CoA-carboxylase] ligase [Bacteroidales bacterium]